MPVTAVPLTQGEAPLWRTPARCEGGACVQVSAGRRAVGVRDSKDPAGPVLLVPAARWRAFTAALRRLNRMIDVSADESGYVTLRHSRYAEAEPGRATFTMTGPEWEDLLWRAASYELERRKLACPLPLEDVLGARLR